MFNHATSSEHQRLAASFEKLLELDNETFLYWVDNNRQDLDSFFFDVLSKSWDEFTAEENKKTDESARQRLTKRKEKLSARNISESLKINKTICSSQWQTSSECNAMRRDH